MELCIKCRFTYRHMFVVTTIIGLLVYLIEYHFIGLTKFSGLFLRQDFETTFDENIWKEGINYVIFDASGYSESLSFLNNHQDDWRVMVTNLEDTTQMATCNACLFLHDAWNKTNITDKWDHLIQKVEIDSKGQRLLAAIIFVLFQEVQWIYITNRPVPIPYKSFSKITKQEVTRGIVYQGPHTVFEPCSHFMDPFTWKGLGDHQIGNRYNIREVSSHSVYYVLNECFRKGMSHQDWQNSLDTKAPIPYIMPGTFGTVDFKNVLVSKPNAWTLIASLFPSDNHNNQTWTKSVQINLMVQRVLWETRSNVGFLPDDHNVGHSCPTCDLQIYLEQSHKDVGEKLTRWRCENSTTVYACLVKLSNQDMTSNKQVRDLISLWISMLESYGWNSNKRSGNIDGRMKEKLTGIPVYYTPSKSLHKTQVNDTRPPNPFANICGTKDGPYASKIPDQHKKVLDDVVLVVVCNKNHTVGNVPTLDYSYGRHFKRIIYCSQNMKRFEEEFRKGFKTNPVSYLEMYLGYNWKQGDVAQGCIEAVMKMGYDAKGYIHISDDSLVNVWTLLSLPFHKPWFQSSIRVLDMKRANQVGTAKTRFWVVWNGKVSGKTESVTAYNRLRKVALDSTNKHSARVSRFLKNLSNVSGCDECLLYEVSDVFYVPRHLRSDYVIFSEFFSKVFLEIAIPTVLVGISSDREIHRLRGIYLWEGDREKHSFYWTEFDHFMHSFKFTIDMKSEKGKHFFCFEFLRRLDADI